MLKSHWSHVNNIWKLTMYFSSKVEEQTGLVELVDILTYTYVLPQNYMTAI